ncbi:MAG: GtrA family protein [Burkholderiaceae bacterium]|nr:GtrA family protein [Burkholderiaceae bacterium]
MIAPQPPGRDQPDRASGMLGQFLRFGLVGLLGFLIDTGLTLGLERGAAWPAFAARPPAIVAAILVTWCLNRGFSFRVNAPLSSVGPYALVATAVALLNYLLFLIGVGHGMGTVAAIFAATAVSMVFSFLGYRYFAFGAYARGPDPVPPRGPNRCA